MRLLLATIEDLVSKTFNRILHVKLGADAKRGGASCKHIFEMLQVFLNSEASAVAFCAHITFFLHLIRGCVISIRISILDQFAAVVLNLFEEVRAVADFVGHDFKGPKVCLNILDEF